MFERLFNKKKSNVSNNSEVELINKSHSSYPKEVLEIHHEFHIASDLLLQQAKSIIAEAATKNVDKIYRLESLGFKQAAQVTEIKPLIEKAKLSETQIELVSYYSLKYPNNKFITEDQVKAICHKYNLVCGDVGRFKGFVPEKNLREIEAFNLKKEDICIVGTCWGNNSRRFDATISYYNFLDLRKKDALRGKSKDLDILTSNNDDIWTLSEDVVCFNPEIKGEYFDRIHIERIKICAPVKDMDISGLELIEGYKLQKKFVPDPIVLQPVKGGYLILTAWGDEASDELVVNQKFN